MSASLPAPRLAHTPVAADARTADDAGRLSFADPTVWVAALLAGGIVFIGARFVVAPATAAAGFGVPLVRVPAAAVPPGGAPAGGRAAGERSGGLSGELAVPNAYFWTKGGRDVASGLVVATFLWAGRREAGWRRPLGTFVAVATAIPLFDAVAVLRFAGAGRVRPLAVHGGTALGMAALAAALLRPRAARA